MYSNDMSYTGTLTLDLIAIVDPLSQLAAVLIVPMFSRRFILLSGCIMIGVFNILIGLFDT